MTAWQFFDTAAREGIHHPSMPFGNINETLKDTPMPFGNINETLTLSLTVFLTFFC